MRRAAAAAATAFCHYVDYFAIMVLCNISPMTGFQKAIRITFEVGLSLFAVGFASPHFTQNLYIFFHYLFAGARVICFIKMQMTLYYFPSRRAKVKREKPPRCARHASHAIGARDSCRRHDDLRRR